MPLPRVFIASASEGLEAARQVHRALQARLRQAAEVVLWPTEFQLSATYIESLERALGESDFAVLVATAADRTRSRGRETASPRDNVIFEAGLFMGRLGRQRSFILKPAGDDLKLPSDLAGVESARFEAAVGRGWARVMAEPCERIAQQVEALGHRRRLSAEAVAAQEAIHLFVKGLVGAWWERVTANETRSALSFFVIEPDPLFSAVTLRGEAYNADGQLAAYWHSLMARADAARREILYHWAGWHPDTSANASFHGLGEMMFGTAGAAADSARVLDGFGRFWDVDEARPGRTRVKPMQLRRITDARALRCMTRGSAADRQALVCETLAGW